MGVRDHMTGDPEDPRKEAAEVEDRHLLAPNVRKKLRKKKARKKQASIAMEYGTLATTAVVVAIDTLEACKTEGPPSAFLLELLLPPDVASDALANLEEVFPLWCSRHGLRRARWIFRAQSWFIVIGNRGMVLLSMAERLLRAARPN
jgi:hypothetical protein